MGKLRVGSGALLLGAIVAMGCEPKCREVKALSVIEAETIERFDERLDYIDATDGQRSKIVAAIKASMPALGKLREETIPRQRLIMAELKRPEPDRDRLGVLISKNMAAGNGYAHKMIDVTLDNHGLFSSGQRQKLAELAAEPSEKFERSWLMDRAVDYFLSRIDATRAQRKLVDKIMQHLIAKAAEVRKKADALRIEGAREYAKDKPDPKKLHATIDRGGELARTVIYDLIGHYLLLASKMDARQRRVLNTELVRFEPCARARGTKSARAHNQGVLRAAL